MQPGYRHHQAIHERRGWWLLGVIYKWEQRVWSLFFHLISHTLLCTKWWWQDRTALIHIICSFNYVRWFFLLIHKILGLDFGKIFLVILLDQTLPNQTIRLGKRPNSLNLAQILFELKLKKEFVQYGLKLKLGRGRFQAKSIVTHITFIAAAIIMTD